MVPIPSKRFLLSDSRAQYKVDGKDMIEMKPVALDSDYCNTWMKTNNRGDSNSQSTLMRHLNSGSAPRPQKFYVVDQDYANSNTLLARE